MEFIQTNFSSVIIESDSHIVIRAIIGDIKAPSIIFNIVADIWVLSFFIVIDKVTL